jgi:hypothetical protein
LRYHSRHSLEEKEKAMEFLLVSEMLGLALVSLLGWWWAIKKVQDLRFEKKSEKAYWMEKVQDLEKELRLEKAKAKVREMVSE